MTGLFLMQIDLQYVKHEQSKTELSEKKSRNKILSVKKNAGKAFRHW